MGPTHNDPASSSADGQSAEQSTVHRVARHVLAQLDPAIERARAHLVGLQNDDGHWCGELEGDTILEGEYILLLAWLGQLSDATVGKAARYIAEHQRTQGGWSLFPGGELEISGSVKAYFALKLAGYDPASRPMRLAREAILAHGGADRVNSFTRFYLALLGQISYDHCPAVPPEIVLLPRWSPVNLYRISAWSRTILVPLSIMWAHRPRREIPESLGIQELFVRAPAQWPALYCPGNESARGLLNWERFFRWFDQWLKRAERLAIHPLRRRAIRVAERWMTDRFVDSDGLGAIFPPIIWSVVALKCLGYGDDSPEVGYCHEQLQQLMIHDADTVRLQPCRSPVWDTALSLRALAATREPGDESIAVGAATWLLEKEARRAGDWAVRVAVEPSGWYFEYHNAFYPDLDDTAVVLTALREHFMPSAEPEDSPSGLPVAQTSGLSMEEARHRAMILSRIMGACQRALRWTLFMQNKDGGWAAFDKDNNARFLCHVPMADHNAMIDPSTPDLTGRVLEALAIWGAELDNPAVARAVRYLRQSQAADGSWTGRWGVNAIYGTWQAIVGLTAVGVSPDDPCLRTAARWLSEHQQTCGGWGESPESYAVPRLRGRGPVTPTQTAWALLGLLACGRFEDAVVERGIAYLISRQRDDGSWIEPEFTGTGFPRVFYLRYHMYPIYFPIMALGRYQLALRQAWN